MRPEEENTVRVGGMDVVVISSYSLEDAIRDGVLVEVFKNRWKNLTGGKPLVATAAIVDAYSLAAIMDCWNGFVLWTRKIKPRLPEEEQLFQTKINGRRVWIIEDGAAYTILFPSEL